MIAPVYSTNFASEEGLLGPLDAALEDTEDPFGDALRGLATVLNVNILGTKRE